MLMLLLLLLMSGFGLSFRQVVKEVLFHMCACPMFAAGSMLCPFLEDHKEDILCGPVWLASGLDLSGHAGMLSLTSPKLVKGDGSHELICSQP